MISTWTQVVTSISKLTVFLGKCTNLTARMNTTIPQITTLYIVSMPHSSPVECWIYACTSHCNSQQSVYCSIDRTSCMKPRKRKFISWFAWLKLEFPPFQRSLHDVPSSTISEISPNVMHGQKHVIKPAMNLQIQFCIYVK